MLYTKSSFQFEDGGSEGTPPSGSWELYFDSDGGHIKSYEGVVSDLGGGGALEHLQETRFSNTILLGPSVYESLLITGNSIALDSNGDLSLDGAGSISLETLGSISLGADKITNPHTELDNYSTGSVDLQLATSSLSRPTAGGNYSTVLGGSGNYIDPSSQYCGITAGSKNEISWAEYSFIGCGRDNLVTGSGPELNSRVHDAFVIGISGVAQRDSEFVRSKGQPQASHILSSAFTYLPTSTAIFSEIMPLNGVSRFDIDILGSNTNGTVYYGSKIHGICTTTGIIRQFVTDEFYTGYTGAFGSEVGINGGGLQIKASGGANMHWWADTKILEGLTRADLPT